MIGTTTHHPEVSRCIQHVGIIDLFAGIGGLSLGAARAGFHILAAVDNDSRTARAYTTNFPGYRHIQADISKLKGAELFDMAEIGQQTVHGLIGGPPCQGFSRIGRRSPKDMRNYLFEHFFRLVEEIHPWFYVAENVLGILDAPFKSMRANVFARLNDYQNLPPLILKSSNFGSATSRERVLFIGYDPEYVREMVATAFEPADQAEKVTVGTALRGLPHRIDPSWQKEPEGWRRLTYRKRGKFWDSIFNNVPPGVGNPDALKRLNMNREVSGCLGTQHTEAVVERFTALEEGSVDSPSRAVRLDRKGFCPTLRAGTGPDHGSFQALRPIHPTEARVITPREAARLQGFPDWFLFDATKWHSFRQIGNSVSPILAENIMRTIAAHL